MNNQTVPDDAVFKDTDELIDFLKAEAAKKGLYTCYTDLASYIATQLEKLQRQREAVAQHEVEAVAWIRTRNGQIDWAEDCLGARKGDALDCYEGEEYDELPLYTTPPLPQDARELLENAAQIVDRFADTASKWGSLDEETDFKECAQAIRNLIPTGNHHE